MPSATEADLREALSSLVGLSPDTLSTTVMSRVERVNDNVFCVELQRQHREYIDVPFEPTVSASTPCYYINTDPALDGPKADWVPDAQFDLLADEGKIPDWVSR